MTEPFNLTVIQPRIRRVFDDDGVFHADALQENLEHHSELILAGWRYSKSKLFVLPEFSLQGFAGGVSVDRWIEAAVQIPGPETEHMGRIAKDTGAYIAFMVYEYMPDWPGRYWNTAVIVGPDGEVVHRYHKLYAQTTKTRPGDVYAEYTRRMGGPDALFPVLDTPIGRIGTLICYDINFPEVTRCLALRGAEIFLHITSEPRAPWRSENGGWMLARRVRAYENVAYLAMANSGPVEGSMSPVDRCIGQSQIIDYNGQVMVEANTSNETMVHCEIDIEALRKRRARPYIDYHAEGMNFLAEVNTAIHAPIYQKYQTWPADYWADTPIQHTEENHQVNAEVVRARIAAGLQVPPEGYRAPARAKPKAVGS